MVCAPLANTVAISLPLCFSSQDNRSTCIIAALCCMHVRNHIYRVGEDNRTIPLPYYRSIHFSLPNGGLFCYGTVTLCTSFSGSRYKDIQFLGDHICFIFIDPILHSHKYGLSFWDHLYSIIPSFIVYG